MLSCFEPVSITLYVSQRQPEERLNANQRKASYMIICVCMVKLSDLKICLVLLEDGFDTIPVMNGKGLAKNEFAKITE